MSTAGGPRLKEIGRTGDSDIALCVDAHDAGSYPGEPTTNLIDTDMTRATSGSIPSRLGWSKDNGCTVTATGETFQGMPVYRVFFPDASLPRTHTDFPYTSGSTYTMNVWYRYISGQTGTHLPQPYITKADFTATFSTGPAFPVTTEWTRMTPLSGTSATTTTAMFNLYRSNSGSATDVTMEFAMPQVEEKSYATPFVREGNGAGTYNARAASTNLMIHGDVGTGTSFYDSSPSKHTVTANNIGSGDDPVHSGVSKFSGGSIYFNGEDYWGVKGSYLSVPDSTDWNFGTGDFTVDFWIRLESLGQLSGGTYRPHQEIIGNYDSTSGFRVSFTYKGTSEDGIWLYGPAGSVRAGNITGWVADTWYHIAVVRSSGNVSIYKDGVLRAGPTSWATSVGDSGHPLVIGADPRANPPTDYPLWGYLDEIRVTKGTALWLTAFTPPTRRNDNGPLVDLSGHDNAVNFATTAMTDVTTYRDGQVIEPIASAVWDFDGTDDYMRGGPITGQVGSTTAKTYEYWFKLQNFAPTHNCFLSMAGNDANNYKWQYVYVGTNGYLQFLYGDNSFYNIYGGSATQVVGSANVWTCVTMSIDISRASDDRVQIYKNGEPVTVSWNTGTRTAFYDGADLRLYIGAFNHQTPINPGDTMEGEMGKVSIWKTGLTAQQAKANFNAQRSRFGV